MWSEFKRCPAAKFPFSQVKWHAWSIWRMLFLLPMPFSQKRLFRFIQVYPNAYIVEGYLCKEQLVIIWRNVEEKLTLFIVPATAKRGPRTTINNTATINSSRWWEWHQRRPTGWRHRAILRQHSETLFASATSGNAYVHSHNASPLNCHWGLEQVWLLAHISAKHF